MTDPLGSLPATSGVRSSNEPIRNEMMASVHSTDQTRDIAELDSSRLTVTLTSTPHAVPEQDSVEVWSHSTTTDHMVTVRWTAEAGWEAPEIKPYAAFSIMPTASCLHYATQCFEGMKCYRGFDGNLRLFRPNLNCERMVVSAARVALPLFNATELEKLVKDFIKVDGSRKSFMLTHVLKHFS